MNSDLVAETPKAGLAPGELGHTLKARHVTMISLGGVVGAGLFVGSAGAIRIGGPGVLLVYAACGVFVLLNMRMLAEMAAANPRRGSFASYVAEALGPWSGYVIRWLYWYCQLFTIGAETVIGANLLSQLGWPGPTWATGLELMALFTMINLVSVRAYGELEFWLASVKVAAIGGFIAIGLAFVATRAQPAHAVAVNLLDHGGLFPQGLAGLIATIPIVMFSMAGSEMATIAAAESDAPAKNVAKAGRSVALRVALFYVASIILIVSIVPWTAMPVGTSPFTTALTAIGIPGAGLAMAVIVLTAVLSCLNSAIYVSSRMLHELGASGDGPAVFSLTTANHTPVVGVLLACAAGTLALLAQFFFRQDMFILLASSTGAIGLFIGVLTALAQIRTRRRLEASGLVLPLKMWLFPWLSYAVILALVAVFIVLVMAPEPRAAMGLSVLAVSVVLASLWVQRSRPKTTR